MKLTNSANKKRILENFISLSILRGFDLFIPLITLPYVIRVVGVDNYGRLALALSLANYFGSVMQYGFSITATREIARNRSNASQLAEIYSITLTTVLALSFICSIAVAITIFSVEKFSKSYDIYILSFFLVTMQSIFPDWFFRGIEKMKFITYISLATKIIFLIGLFSLVTKIEDFYLVPLLNGIAALVSFISALWLIRYKFDVHYTVPNFALIKTQIIDGRHIFISRLAPNLYNNSSIFLLGIFASETLVGYYSSATKLIGAIISLGNILAEVFLPYLSRNLSNHPVFQKIMLSSGLVLTILPIVFAEFIVSLLFTNSNLDIAKYVQYLSPMIFFVFLRLTYGNNYLMITGHEKQAKNIILYVCLLFFFIAIVSIPILNVYGSIIVMIGASLSMALLTYIYYLKVKKGIIT